MKKTLLKLLFCVSLLVPGIVIAQSFSVKSDTVNGTVTGVGTESVYNFITNNTHAGLALKWSVINTNFPTSWLTPSAFGICDNNLCYANNGPKWLWNEAVSSGYTFKTNPYTDTTTHGDFHLSLSFASAVAGTYWVTINLTDTVTAYSKTMTFIVNKFPTAVPATPKSYSDIVLYPNPATNELNIIYDANADIKNIAVYNVIGKLMTVYKVSNNSGANLNLENLQSGMYFVRLMNSHGDVVANRKFNKQ